MAYQVLARLVEKTEDRVPLAVPVLREPLDLEALAEPVAPAELLKSIVAACVARYAKELAIATF